MVRWKGPQPAQPEPRQEGNKVHTQEELYRFHGGQVFYKDPVTGEARLVTPERDRVRPQGVKVPLTWEQAAQLDLIAAAEGGTRADLVAALIRERLEDEPVPYVGMPVTEAQFRHDMFAAVERATMDGRMAAQGKVPRHMPEDYPYEGTVDDRVSWHEHVMVERIFAAYDAIAANPPLAYSASGKVVTDDDGRPVLDMRIPVAALQGMLAVSESLRRLRGDDAPKDIRHQVALSADLDEQIRELKDRVADEAYARAMRDLMARRQLEAGVVEADWSDDLPGMPARSESVDGEQGAADGDDPEGLDDRDVPDDQAEDGADREGDG